MKPTHCPYCNRKMSYAPVPHKTPQPANLATKDHIVPRCKGGGKQPYATLYVCYACNQDKGSLTLNEWRAALCVRRRRLHLFAFERRALANMARNVAIFCHSGACTLGLV